MPYPVYVHLVQKAGDRRRSQLESAIAQTFLSPFPSPSSQAQAVPAPFLLPSRARKKNLGFVVRRRNTLSALQHDPAVVARSSSDTLYWTLCLLTAGEARAARVLRVFCSLCDLTRGYQSGILYPGLRRHMLVRACLSTCFSASLMPLCRRVGFRFHCVTAIMEVFF